MAPPFKPGGPIPPAQRQERTRAALKKAGGAVLPSVNLPAEAAADLARLKAAGYGLAENGSARGQTKAIVVDALDLLARREKLKPRK